MKICENSTITRLSLGAAFVLGSAISASAATFPAYTINPTATPNLSPLVGNPVTLGMQIQVLNTLNVAQLGAYRGTFAGPGQGLTAPRTVTLWNVATQTAVPGLTVTINEADPGNTISADGNFIYSTLAAPVSIGPGLYRLSSFIAENTDDTNYAIFPNGDLTFPVPASVIASPGANKVQDTAFVNANTYPDFLITGEYIVAANIIFDDGMGGGGGGGGTTTPEPSLVGGLILLGLGGLFQKMKR